MVGIYNYDTYEENIHNITYLNCESINSQLLVYSVDIMEYEYNYYVITDAICNALKIPLNKIFLYPKIEENELAKTEEIEKNEETKKPKTEETEKAKETERTKIEEIEKAKETERPKTKETETTEKRRELKMKTNAQKWKIAKNVMKNVYL